MIRYDRMCLLRARIIECATDGMIKILAARHHYHALGPAPLGNALPSCPTADVMSAEYQNQQKAPSF